MNNPPDKSPTPDIADVSHALLIGAADSIPIAGPIVKQFISAFVDAPVVERRWHWVESIAIRVTKLEEKYENIKDNLATNEEFKTAFLYAGQIAIRSHQTEKLEALQNAVLNTAIPGAIDDSQQQIFLNYIDTFTEWHIRILKFLDNPIEWGKIHNIKYPNLSSGGVSAILIAAFPEMKDKRPFYDQIVYDLHERGLLNKSKDFLHVLMTSEGIFSSHSSVSGKLFLNFIKSPFDN
jgi:hypothetical protein